MEKHNVDLLSLPLDEFVSTCEVINGFEDYKSRLIQYYKFTGRFPDSERTQPGRIIDGVEYSINIEPRNQKEAHQRAILYYELFHQIEIENKLKDFYDRYYNCGTISEREKFLDSEANRIKNHTEAEHFKSTAAYPGYEAVERKLSRPNFGYNSTGDITIDHIKSCIFGMTLYNIELTIQEEKRKLEILKELKPNLDYYKNGNDPFAIEFSSENSITMQGQKLYFPFDCYGICILLVELRMELISPTVSALTLQRFPELIFDPEKFTGHYKLAAFVYNIIETWIMEYQITYHYNTKKQLFDEYLNICKNLALSFKEPIKISEESVINRSDSSNLQYPSVIKEDSCEPLSNEAAYLKQTVDEYLEPFKSSKAISEVDYPKILNSLTDYFEGKIIPPRQPYLVGSRNKKKLAFALGLLYRGLRKERNIAYEYLVLCKGLFQCYQDEKIDIKAINRSTLYKYFTSKPQ